MNRHLIDLPLSFGRARLAENFAYKVIPGVAGNSWTSYIHGSTAYSKDTPLDGATVTTYLSSPFGESSVSVEALEEFKIQTSGMSAEFGRTQAGLFNYVMKSGANSIHGNAYGALRNEAFNANTFVNKARGLPRSQDRKQNCAGSFGGHTTRDSTAPSDRAHRRSKSSPLSSVRGQRWGLHLPALPAEKMAWISEGESARL